MTPQEQANFFITLVYQDDMDSLKRGERIDLWLSEQVCIEGLAKIYEQSSPACTQSKDDWGWDGDGRYIPAVY